MKITYVMVLVAIVRALVSAERIRQPAITTLISNTPQSLCSSCAYAHIAHGYGEREKLIACTYGGLVRPLKFAVSKCTLYCNRNAGSQIVRIAGFAQLQDAQRPLIAAKSG
jgi:hypothetical protein